MEILLHDTYVIADVLLHVGYRIVNRCPFYRQGPDAEVVPFYATRRALMY